MFSQSSVFGKSEVQSFLTSFIDPAKSRPLFSLFLKLNGVAPDHVTGMSSALEYKRIRLPCTSDTGGGRPQSAVRPLGQLAAESFLPEVFQLRGEAGGRRQRQHVPSQEDLTFPVTLFSGPLGQDRPVRKPFPEAHPNAAAILGGKKEGSAR